MSEGFCLPKFVIISRKSWVLHLIFKILLNFNILISADILFWGLQGNYMLLFITFSTGIQQRNI